MKKNYLLLVAFVVTTITFGQNSPGDIIITEIMQNPNAVSDANGEWFEVYNTTGSDIDMNGWTIEDLGSDSHIISLSLIVPAYGYAVLGRNGDIVTNGGVSVNYVFSGITIGNADDELILIDSFSVTIDQVNWDDGVTFPDPTGASMELSINKYNTTDNNTGLNWGIAITVFGAGDLGTPGTVNDFTLGIVKNQIEGFALYPNPISNGKLFIKSSANLNQQVEIYSMIGQQVYNKNVEVNEIMDVSNLTKGIYMIKVEEEGRVATRKLIVN